MVLSAAHHIPNTKKAAPGLTWCGHDHIASLLALGLMLGEKAHQQVMPLAQGRVATQADLWSATGSMQRQHLRAPP